MQRSAVLVLTAVTVFATHNAVRAQEQFSRAAFLDAMKGAAQTQSWKELIWIPQLSVVTEGRKADYVLALAYLASQECGPAIVRADESRNYLVLKADGLFTAYGYDPANPAHVAARRASESMGMKPRIQLSFASAFQSAASQVLKQATSGGECIFASGWSGNDSRQTDFLRRTCTDLKAALYPEWSRTSR